MAISSDKKTTPPPSRRRGPFARIGDYLTFLTGADAKPLAKTGGRGRYVTNGALMLAREIERIRAQNKPGRFKIKAKRKLERHRLPSAAVTAEQELRTPPTQTLASSPETQVIQLDYVTVFGSKSPPANVVIDAPGAAPRQFTLIREDGQFRLLDHGHGHGLYVDEHPVSWAMLLPGDHFDFADHRYRILEDGSGLEVGPLGKCDLIVAGLCAQIDDQKLLTNMSFVQREEDESLLVILGPSGAGKTSLFYALLGELKTEKGEVFFLGLDLKTHTEQIREHLGFVPQDIDLYQTLTVRRLLRYSLRLRSNWPRAEREERIAEVCEQLHIESQMDQLVTTLSGGQRKRVSIALELLTKPKLLMLDEPTSGLDAGLDREFMTTLGDYAAEGNTVIVSTHSPEHLGSQQSVLILAEDGCPVYCGPKHYARRVLGGGSYADLMAQLTADPGPAAENYAIGRRASEAKREAEHARTELAKAKQSGPAHPVLQRGPVRPFPRQLWVMFLRQVSLVMARGATGSRRPRTRWERMRCGWVVLFPLISAFGAALLAGYVTGGAGLGADQRGNSPGAALTAVSLLTTLCMLSGQALTYSDIVCEYPIIRREHRTGALTLAVTLSKWLVFAVVAVLQALLITLVFVTIRPGPTHALVFDPVVELFFGLAVLTVGAMSLGLLISVVAPRLETAVGLVTVVSIVQIALNGVTADLSHNRLLNAIAWLLPDRWGLASVASSTDLRAITVTPVPGKSVDDALWSHNLSQWLFDLSMLLLLTVACFTAATLLLRRRLNATR